MRTTPLRIELGRPKNHVWLIAIAYTTKPTIAEVLDRGMPSSKFETAEIGPLPTATALDRDRVARWLTHLSVHWHLLDFKDPFQHRFLDAFSPSKEDDEIGMDRIRSALAEAVFALRGDIPRSRLVLPLGTLLVERVEGFVSTVGDVPPFARLVIDTEAKGGNSDWFPVTTVAFPVGFYMSTRAREALFAEFFGHAARTLSEGLPFTLAEDAGAPHRRVALVAENRNLRVEPSKGYVLHLNRDRPRLTTLLEYLPEPEWRTIYDRSEAASDPRSLLEERVAREPHTFEHYKALADYHAREGRIALSHLTLGLGYLRAQKLRSVARGKLELARDADPRCPGLDEAFAELKGN